MARINALYEAISRGDRQAVDTEVNQALKQAIDPESVLMESMIPAMRDLGERFSRNEVFVPEMLIAARAMAAGMAVLEPVLVARGHKPLGTVCIGTVKGDLHDIGKNLVAMMLKGAGFHVLDLGVDASMERFAEGVEQGAQAVLLSALLTTTMPYMRQVVEHFNTRPEVKIIIGGAPVTRHYAEEIGAHGYGSDANDAVKEVERVLGIKR